MGLDMYLKGEAFYTFDHPNRKESPLEIESTIYRLGYWRKHSNLHGFIVQTFADGVDDCKEIELSVKDIDTITKAIDAEELPHTDGFFFGASAADPEVFMAKYGCTMEEALSEKQKEKEQDNLILRRASEWLETKEHGVWKSVTYRASW